MKVQNIRFSDRQWELVTRMAEHAAMPAAAYVREAAVLRAAFEWGREGNGADEAHEATKEVREVLVRHGVL